MQYDSLSNHCLLRVIMTSGGIHTSQKIAKYCSQIACQELKKGITSLHHAEKNSLIHQKCQQHKAEN